MGLKSGDLVDVRAFGGRVVKRRLVRVDGQTAVLTTPEEAESASREQREPFCIGFPLSDVVKAEPKRAFATDR